jgi:hypothetical protein
MEAVGELDQRVADLTSSGLAPCASLFRAPSAMPRAAMWSFLWAGQTGRRSWPRSCATPPGATLECPKSLVDVGAFARRRKARIQLAHDIASAPSSIKLSTLGER